MTLHIFLLFLQIEIFNIWNMANNKHALLRYETLDRCLGDKRAAYNIEDLKKACNKVLYSEHGEDCLVEKRQIYYDLQYMQEHYNAPIARERDGHSMILYYSDPDFSIRKRPLSQNDIAQLKDTLTLLSRFKGMPKYDWVEEIVGKLAAEFKLDENCAAYVCFEQKEEIPGIQHFEPVLEAIAAKQVITFRYKPMNKEELKITLSPHYLKQYNHRWYVLGHDENVDFIPNYALNRIKGEVKVNRKKKYTESDVNYEKYFNDIIGVTHYEDSELEEIVLQVDDDYISYLESNPIHDSLRPVRGMPGCYKIKVRFNHELVTTIFAHLDKIRVVQDPSGKLTAELRRRWEKAGEKIKE